MKGPMLGIALTLSAGLMGAAFQASASNPPPGDCVEGQVIQVSTGIRAYTIYQCYANAWHYMGECDESGYCFIAPPG